MSIVIVAEKQFISRAIASFARERWPGEKIVMVAGNSFRHVAFSYPGEDRLGERPLISAPHYKVSPWSEWSVLEVDAAGGVAAFEMTDDLFYSAETIVFACDPGYAGAALFSTVMEHFFGGMPDRPTPALTLLSLDSKSIAKAFANLDEFADRYGGRVDYGRAKRYFDWNWNVNSLSIMSATARLSGVGANDKVSKFGLQFLYFLDRQKEGLPEGAAHGAMRKWHGSGRQGTATSHISSAASSGQIIENLIESGFVARLSPAAPSANGASLPKGLSVTAAGARFLDNLHPDCRDVDLPFRLEKWCSDGLGASKPKMDRYLKEYFGKQRRFVEAFGGGL